MNCVKDILDEIGIKITSINDSGFAQFCPVYRNSDNPKGASINLKNGWTTDWSLNENFPIEVLVEKMTGKKPDKKFINKISSLDLDIINDESEVKFWSKDSLLHLLPDHSYWINRGISKETLDFFQGGVSHSGKLYKRYVWPCFDRHQRIVGFTGRDLTGKNEIKYKHEGKSTNFLFGLYNKQNDEFLILKSILKSSHLILVEGPSDSVACFDEGITNVLPTMGLNISKSMMSFILGVNPSKITICYNKDEKFNGQNAAVKNYTRLFEYFPESNLEIRTPQKNDLSDDKSNIKNFFNQAPDDIISLFREKYLRCKSDVKQKMSQKEVNVGKVLSNGQ
jgi:hypothetical protein